MTIENYTLHKLPSWMPMYGITLGRHVFLKDVTDVKALAHECVHVNQQLAHPIWFWVSYLLILPLGWSPFRVRWEAEAYAIDVLTGRLTQKDAADMLAGSLYLWPCSRTTAFRVIGEWIPKSV